MRCRKDGVARLVACRGTIPAWCPACYANSEYLEAQVGMTDWAVVVWFCHLCLMRLDIAYQKPPALPVIVMLRRHPDWLDGGRND